MEVNFFPHVPIVYQIAPRTEHLLQGAPCTPYSYDRQKPWLAPDRQIGAHSDEIIHYLVQGYKGVARRKSLDATVAYGDYKDLIRSCASIPSSPYAMDHWVVNLMGMLDDQ